MWGNIVAESVFSWRERTIAHTRAACPPRQVEQYHNCQMEFLGIDNIHVMRKSMHRLRGLIVQPEDAAGEKFADARELSCL